MNKLEIDFEHCFGIHKLKHTFDFEKNIVLIYAPNGMMKSSFAKTFDCIGKGDKKIMPLDRIYTDRMTKCKILVDDREITPSTIFVSNGEINIDAHKRISTFLASRDLKERYDEIHSNLNDIKQDFIRKLKDKSQSSDCEIEFVRVFAEDKNDDLFTCLNKVSNDLNDPIITYDFKYNDIFDKKGKVEDFVKTQNELLREYFDQYSQLLNESSFFKTNTEGVSFGTHQATLLSKAVEDNAFFQARHKLVLGDEKSIGSSEDLQRLISNEIEDVFKDENLKKSFVKIDKAIGKNSELNTFKVLIEKKNDLIPYLLDYEGFRKDVWLSYLNNIKEDVLRVLEKYGEYSEELKKILKKAGEQHDQWDSIISLYNRRFDVPFKVGITNKEDVILKQKAATLEFVYDDSSGSPTIQEQEKILEVLSNGEKRAFFILQLMFEIEARKVSHEENLIILDDIAESFDYKNKYAIIEYIEDLYRDSKFKIIILTHNFDFYRTIDSRFTLGNSTYMVTKDSEKTLKLCRGEYRRDAFSYLSKKISKKTIFISLIPFVRNIIEYTKGDKSDEYKILTSCLHIRKGSENILATEVYDIISSNIKNAESQNIEFGEAKILDLIFQSADTIVKEDNIKEISLENKLVLSIACRLSVEKFILDCIDDIDTNSIRSNQTRDLIDKYENSKGCEKEKLKLFKKVNLMTPENIHLNSFMYEPIIDLSIAHLVSLYNELQELYKHDQI